MQTRSAVELGGQMRFLTREQLTDWLKRHLEIDLMSRPLGDLPRTKYDVVRIPFPQDSGRKTYLARLAYGCFKAEKQVLVYLENCEIFPSSGHMPLLTRFRQALGELRPVEEAPGHLFSKVEEADAVSIVVMSLEFFWNCLVVAESGRVVFSISHDEVCDLFCADKAIMAEFEKVAGETGLIVP